MKKLVVAGCAALALCAVASTNSRGVTLSDVQIQQRYPWNGLVDIDYTISSDSGAELGPDDNLEVWMVDKAVSPAVTNYAVSFLQTPLPMTAGRHRITWDANADGVLTRTDNAEFHVEIAHYPEAYMIIDVSKGPNATVYPTTFVNRPPVGEDGFNTDEYKTGKIVLRRIHAGSYIAGSPENEHGRDKFADRERQRRVALSKPFYIGIFEVTQKQYENVMGVNPTDKNANDKRVGDTRPVTSAAYADVRGGQWPSEENPNPSANTFMDKLCKKCKALNSAATDYTEAVTGFDLPTEAQWEFACRAGTTHAYNTTNEFENTEAGLRAQMELLGRCLDTDPKKEGHTVVGSYEPNAWGLYDMHGNAWEWCLDWYVVAVDTLGEYKDPRGPSAGTENKRVERGGSFADTYNACRSAIRSGGQNGGSSPYVAFRLIRNLP